MLQYLICLLFMTMTQSHYVNIFSSQMNEDGIPILDFSQGGSLLICGGGIQNTDFFHVEFKFAHSSHWSNLWNVRQTYWRDYRLDPVYRGRPLASGEIFIPSWTYERIFSLPSIHRRITNHWVRTRPGWEILQDLINRPDIFGNEYDFGRYASDVWWPYIDDGGLFLFRHPFSASVETPSVRETVYFRLIDGDYVSAPVNLIVEY